MQNNKGRELLWATVILDLSLSYDTQQSRVTVQINHPCARRGLPCLLQSLCSLISFFFFSHYHNIRLQLEQEKEMEERVCWKVGALKKKFTW